MTFDWNQARAFLATAQTGSFSAAARLLRVAQPTIGRQVAALEQSLDVALVERVGRGLKLTPAGLELAEHVATMGQAAARISLAAAGQSTSLEGVVRITASQAISAHLLTPAIRRVRAEHPGIQLELVASNEARDLRRREADIAVRNFRPRDPQLVAARLPDRSGRLYATAEYLASLGDPTTPEGLSNAVVFAFEDPAEMITGMAAFGLELTEANFPILSADHLVQWELARAGLGVCVMMDEIADADPSMLPLLPDLPPIPVQMWLTSHRELRTSRRMRVVFDLLRQELSQVD